MKPEKNRDQTRRQEKLLWKLIKTNYDNLIENGSPLSFLEKAEKPDDLTFFETSEVERNESICKKIRCQSFFSRILVVILKISDVLFGSEYKREIYISQAADNNSFLVRWSERVVIMHSCANFSEIKRANARNNALIRRVIEIKRTSVNYSLAERFASIQMRMRNFVYA